MKPFTKRGLSVGVVMAVVVAAYAIVVYGGPNAPVKEEAPPPFTNPEAARRLTLAAGPSREPQLVRTSDRLFLAWFDARGGTDALFLKSSADGGGTFTSDLMASARATRAGNLTAAGDPQTPAAAVAWDAFAVGERRVLYLYSHDGGQWSPAIDIGQAYQPSVAVRGWNVLLAFLADDPGNGTRILRVVRVTHDATGPTNATSLTAFATTGSGVAMALGAGRLHLVWDERMNSYSSVVYASVDLDTGSLQGPVSIASIEGRVDPDSLGIAVSGRRLYAVWSDDSAGHSAVYAGASRDGGEVWETRRLSPYGAEARYPTLTLNSTGVPHVAWADRRAEGWQVYRKAAAPGPERGYEQRLSNSRSGAIRPSIAADGEDATAVVWQDSRHGQTELYGDFDSDLSRPMVASFHFFVKRLPDQAFRSPPKVSRARVLGEIETAGKFLGAADEGAAARQLRAGLRPLLDGRGGGSPDDDLIVEARAQNHLLPRIDRLIRELEGQALGGEGTRTLPPETPGPPDVDPFIWIDYQVTENTATSARVSWSVIAEDPAGGVWTRVDASWLDYWLFGEPPTRVWDNSTPFSVLLTGLTRGMEYHFKIGALLSNGETVWSRNDTFWTMVIITDIQVRDLAHTSANITWKTNLASTTTLYYGTTNNYGLQANGTSGVNHSVVLTGLTPKTLYYFYVQSVALDDATLIANSTGATFATGMRIVWGPSLGWASGITYPIDWKTTMAGTSKVYWGTTSALGNTATGPNSTWDLQTAHGHTVWITSPPTKKTIYYKVESASHADPNDIVQSNTFTFSTYGISIWGWTFVSVGETSVTLHWTTRVGGYTSAPATTVVRYGITMTETYTDTVTGPSGWDHWVNITGLASGTTYHFELESVSASNPDDVYKVKNRTFTTRGILITGAVNPEPVDATYAVIRWSTTTNGTSEVWVVVNQPGRVGQWVSGANGTAHEVNLTGLHPLTTYWYRVRSKSVANPNDAAWAPSPTDGYFFTTPYMPDDAGTLTDAGETVATALQTVPGNHTGQLEETLDLSDHFKVWALSGQHLEARLKVPAGHNYDLALLDPSGAPVATSANPGSAEESLAFDLNATGFWYLRATYASGTYYGQYELRFNLTGSWLDRFDLEVGPADDGDVNAHLPGLSLDLSTGWSTTQTSGTYSRASWDELWAHPDYRESGVNSTFFLNLYGASSHRYTDWLITLQYYATQDVNLSVYNGGGWVQLGVLYGVANWYARSFRMPHTYLFDGDASRLGWNVKFALSNVTQVDKITARAFGYTTYVGSGSDDQDWTYHLPGVLLDGGWVDEGQGYKNGTVNAGLLLTVPEPSIAYSLGLRFNATGQYIWATQWDGASWVKVAKLANYTSDVRFTLSTDSWATDDMDSRPGRNLRLRFEAEARELRSIVVTWGGFDDDVGDLDDGDLSAHDPGITLLFHPLNSEWSVPLPDMSGRMYRHGNASAGFYINSPAPDTDYTITVTYRASASGYLQQWTGWFWQVLGTVYGGGVWRTDNYTADGPILSDWYGNYGVNARFQFSVAVDVDSLAAEPDTDRDGISDFRETYAYPTVNTTDVVLEPGESAWYPVFSGGAGRYQLEALLSGSSSLFYVEIDNKRELTLSGSLNGWVRVNASFCEGWHDVGLYHGGNPFVDPDVTVDEIRWYRDPTDPTAEDTDRDGSSDREEICALESKATDASFLLEPTDPLDPDTDGDGLTDFQELYSFDYQDLALHVATPGQNYTLNLTVQDLGAFTFDVSATGHAATGMNATLAILVNGLPKYRFGGSGTWSRSDTFDARLVKGPNSIRFVIEESGGSVDITSLNVAKWGWLTSPTDPDTDKDGIQDGDELRGDTGWVLNPTDPDSDDDGLLDGRELSQWRTDPTNPDTDGDGTGDFEDSDKLHDLVVQVDLSYLTVEASYDPDIRYYAEVSINGQWVTTRNSDFASFNLDHRLSVNVDDGDPGHQYHIRVLRNDFVVIDVTPSTATKEIQSDWFYGDEQKCTTTTGTTTPWGTLTYCVRNVKVGKVNTLLVVPSDWSTVFNGSMGQHRYMGEQKFAFVALNVSGSSANFASGMNAILVPRGVYFDTAFHRLLNDTWENASSSPLANATVIGNEANNTRGLNARVAQLLVSHNVTAAQAEDLLASLLTNASGGQIAVVLDVTDEYYTMGFVNDVGDLVPNVAVENTGDFEAPAPPPPEDSFWTSFWNALAGAVQFVWNAIQAVAVFVAQVVAAVVQFALSVVQAFVEAAYAAIVAVAKAIVDAILAIVKFFLDLIGAVLRAVFDPLIELPRQQAIRTVNDLDAIYNGRRLGTRGDGDGEEPLDESTPMAVSALTGNLLLTSFVVAFAIFLTLLVAGGLLAGGGPLGTLIAISIIVLVTAVIMFVFANWVKEENRKNPADPGDAPSEDDTPESLSLFASALDAGIGAVVVALVGDPKDTSEKEILGAYALAVFGIFIGMAGAASNTGSSQSCIACYVGAHLSVFTLLSLGYAGVALLTSAKLTPWEKFGLGLGLLILGMVALMALQQELDSLRRCL